MKTFFESLASKKVEQLTINMTKANWGNANCNYPARHNFLNGYYQDEGFLGIGKSNFGGNSFALQNLMMSQS